MKRTIPIFQKKDLCLILSALLLAAALFLWFHTRESSGIAVVERGGTEIGRYDLSRQTASRIIDVGGSMHVKLILEPGAISFQHSDCRDQICVRTGKLTRPGQSAVCVPGKVSVRIIAGGGKKLDGYTG